MSMQVQPSLPPLAARAIRAAATVLLLSACGGGADARPAATTAESGEIARTAAADSSNAGTASSTASSTGTDAVGPVTSLPPNELGRVPILEYHLIGDTNTMWMVEREQFKRQLQLLYERGYRPITIKQLVSRKFDLPRGTSPIVLVFDDASPSQFRYVERNGQLEIDPTSAVGILVDFAKRHPGWENRAVFCMLPAAEAGRSFFGNKGIEGQKTEWRFQKVRFLAEQGFELCNHTLWHAQLSKYPDAFVQEQIARGNMAIDSAVPGYQVKTFALPLGLWPKNRELAWRGRWTDPKSGRTVTYEYDTVLEVAGGPARSPHDPQFDPRKLPRFIVHHNELEKLVEQMDRQRTRYVSDGDPSRVARPAAAAVASGAAPSSGSGAAGTGATGGARPR